MYSSIIFKKFDTTNEVNYILMNSEAKYGQNTVGWPSAKRTDELLSTKVFISGVASENPRILRSTFQLVRDHFYWWYNNLENAWEKYILVDGMKSPSKSSKVVQLSLQPCRFF